MDFCRLIFSHVFHIVDCECATANLSPPPQKKGGLERGSTTPATACRLQNVTIPASEKKLNKFSLQDQIDRTSVNYPPLRVKYEILSLALSLHVPYQKLCFTVKVEIETGSLNIQITNCGLKQVIQLQSLVLTTITVSSCDVPEDAGASI